MFRLRPFTHLIITFILFTCFLLGTTLPALAATKTLTTQQKIQVCTKYHGDQGYSTVDNFRPGPTSLSANVWQCNGSYEVQVTRAWADKYCKDRYGRKSGLQAIYRWWVVFVDWGCK